MLNKLWTATSAYFLHPIQFVRAYQRSNLRPDIVAGLTVAVVLLPQAIAYAMIAELPPQVGLYSAIVAAIVGALWGSSNQLHTGPTNAASLLVLTILLPIAEPGTSEFLTAAGLMAVMVGVFRLVMGLARLGMLVNFVSDSVIIGFTAGAGMLISVNQLRHLLRLDFPSNPGLIITLRDIIAHIHAIHWISLGLGAGGIVLIAIVQRFESKWPAPFIVMSVAAAIVGGLGLDGQGVEVIGQIPRSLPPLADLPLLDFELITQLFPGMLAVGALGLVEAMAIARSIAGQSGQRLDSNQEFVGQGMANIACGLFSGYTASGSFIRSAVNFNAGGQTPMSSVFSGIFVLAAMFLIAPLAAYVPRSALAGVLMVTAYGMIDRQEMARIWRGTRGDAVIMVMTFLSTLFLPLQFAVLTGILLSFIVYVMRTSTPRVIPVLPARDYSHFAQYSDARPCAQLAILDIFGDLYFGAVNHVEEAIHSHLEENPGQRFLLLRMVSVDQVDISGVHALESIVRSLRKRGGDVFMMRTQEPVLNLMKSTGFYEYLGHDHFFSYDDAIGHLFHHILDPVICIYECEARVFEECQNLPKRIKHPVEIPIHTEMPAGHVAGVTPQELWDELHSADPPLVVDVREPREFKRGHIPQAESIPLFELLSASSQIPHDRPVVFVCRSGRRSTRATYLLTNQGYTNTRVLRGGILAWETAGLLEAVDI
ncbi:MAG: STAS domain-containing protein [Chloroflexi bacterium]|nr:STAS domain-containing protein [Chloroflexota bacterium]